MSNCRVLPARSFRILFPTNRLIAQKNHRLRSDPPATKVLPLSKTIRFVSFNMHWDMALEEYSYRPLAFPSLDGNNPTVFTR